MKTLKAFFARLSSSKWEYDNYNGTRTHKETGKMEYFWFDDWGSWYANKPMFSDYN